MTLFHSCYLSRRFCLFVLTCVLPVTSVPLFYFHIDGYSLDYDVLISVSDLLPGLAKKNFNEGVSLMYGTRLKDE